MSKKSVQKQREEDSSVALSSDPQYQVRVWIHKRYLEFCGRLIELLYAEEAGLQLPALAALLEFERFAGQSVSGKLPTFANVLYPWVVGVLVHNRGRNEQLLEEFRDSYANVFDDVRLYLFVNCATLTHSYDPASRRYFVTAPTENIKITSPLPYLLDEDEFHESLVELMLDLNMATKPEHLNNFLVQLNEEPAKKQDQANKKKRKRQESSDDDSDLDLDAIGLDSAEEQEEAQPQVAPKLLDMDAHKSAFSKAWLALMARKLSPTLHMRILAALEKHILPHMSSPVTLFDYLSQCYANGGVLGMLSLGGLFILLRKYNVEYPDFFPRLYTMLSPSTFYVRQRKRFFELATLFLEGANLPLYMLCAFLKRLSRLSLTASPQGCMLMISMVYRILIRHPAARVLLHRTENYDPNAETPADDELKPLFSIFVQKRIAAIPNDPYNMEERDPAKCRAIESSLWEMKALANHAAPAVATLAQLLFGSNELKAATVNVQDFIEESYQSLFEAEFKRKTNNSALNFQLPKHLFDRQLFASHDLKSTENLMAYQDSQLVERTEGPTSSALFAEKKKRKSFAELKVDRKKKELNRVKRPRFAMK